MIDGVWEPTTERLTSCHEELTRITRLVSDLERLGSRIIAVADTFDAMTSDRPYRRGLSHNVAIEEIIKNQNSQFDKKVVNAFLEILKVDNEYFKSAAYTDGILTSIDQVDSGN